MSKELEVIPNYTLKEIIETIWQAQGEQDYGFDEEIAKYIEQALTPPTEQEVCEALSDIYGICVRYNKEKNVFEKFEDYMWKRIDILKFKNSLPHLIIMIGKFYESKVNENV